MPDICTEKLKLLVALIVPKQIRMTFITKLFVWSVVLEPLLFFIVEEQSVGIGHNLSRLLQILVIILLGMRITLNNSTFKIPNPFYKEGRDK